MYNRPNKWFELRICSFCENSTLKCNSFEHLIRVLGTWKACSCWNNLVFRAHGTSYLSKCINMKRLYIKLGKKKHAVSWCILFRLTSGLVNPPKWWSPRLRLGADWQILMLTPIQCINCILHFCLKIFFTDSNSVDSDEMQHFHLGLHCLQKYKLMGFTNTF